ncbi:MAG TPA: glycosyl hydrolase, partial [Candidatus Angelobacter sp.]|nr:glycosyl hydrolase [Candidatus Angelobacter sp.]
FWVLDDITPLRQYNDSVPQQQAHLFNPAATNHTVFGGSPFGGGGAVGKNPPGGAVIYYWLKDSLKKPEKKDGAAAGGDSGKTEGDKSEAPKIRLEILDASGKTIRKFPKKEVAGGSDDEDFFSRGGGAADLPADAGLNRFVWDLRYEGATKVPKAPLWGGSTEGPVALPGAYQVRLTVLDKSSTAPLEITSDPRLTVTQADLTRQFDLLMKIRDQLSTTNDTILQIRQLREQISAVDKHVGSAANDKAIIEAGKSLNKKLTEVEEVLVQTKAKSGQDVLNYPVRLNNHFAALGGVVGSADTAPTQQSYEVFELLSKQLSEQMAKWNEIVSTDVPAYNSLVKQRDVPALKVTASNASK